MLEPSTVRLVPPNPELLPGYAAALERGWSPNTDRDVSAEQLARLRADPTAFLDDLTREDGFVTLGDGRQVPRLPFRLFWISDGEFAGSINLRFERGTEELPAHVSGHIGYSVVPWKRRRGYATRALALVLPVARGGSGARARHLRRRQRPLAQGHRGQRRPLRGHDAPPPPRRPEQAAVLDPAVRGGIRNRRAAIALARRS